jgi:hypothetical protein
VADSSFSAAALAAAHCRSTSSSVGSLAMAATPHGARACSGTNTLRSPARTCGAALLATYARI